MQLDITDEVAEQLIEPICGIPFAGKYCPHVPEPPQHAFLTLEQLEAMYGGAAGGGKSDALLMAAAQYVHVPTYSALIMRRTFAELSLEGALLSRAHKWFGATDAKWNGNEMRWRFPSGASLQFGYLSNLNDRARYQSAEFQFIGIDEVTDWEESDYRFMFSRLRRTVEAAAYGVPIRMRVATNPGGRGHRWVKARFIDRTDGKASWERPYIPAKLTDNPHLDQVSYLNALHELDPGQAQMLINGDWDAREPGDWVIGDPAWVNAAVEFGTRMWEEGPPNPVNQRLYSGTDWGEITQSYCIWELAHGGVLIPPSEVIGEHQDPAITSHAIIQSMLRFTWPWYSGRYDAAGVQSMRTMMGIARQVPGLEYLKSSKVPFNQYKKETMGYLRTLFRRVARGETSRVIGIHESNEQLIYQLKRWQRKGPETDDVIKEDDHGPDAIVAGVAHIAAKHRAYIEKEIVGAKVGDNENVQVLRDPKLDPAVAEALGL